MKKLSLAFTALAVLCISCQKEEIDAEFTQNPTESIIGAETALPDNTNTPIIAYIDGQKVEGIEHTIDGEVFLVVDNDLEYKFGSYTYEPVTVVLEPGQDANEAHKSIGSSRANRRWTDNTVYYIVDTDLPKKNRVTDAIAHWEQNTALKFVKRTNQKNYIQFRRGSGCSSSVGMVGGRQYITLSDGCSTGNNIHEIGHAVGLMHEQTRSDRDKHVTVNFSNIQSGKEHNFRIANTDYYDDFGNFDFGSIMMYSSYSFAKNRNIRTITKKDGSGYTTQRKALSTGDKAAIAKMYPAKTTTPTPEPTPNPAPTYENGKSYVIYGVRVHRYYNRWYYWNSNQSSSRYGWNKVKLVDKTWYYE